MPKAGCDDRNDRKIDRIAERLQEHRTILISEPVSSELAKDIVARLLLMDLEKPGEPIHVFINSPGGTIDDGFAIFDTMRFIRSPIRTICTGLAASMATVLLLAAEKGHRYVMPGCRAMIHQPSGGAIGAASDIAISAEQILKLRERINRLLAEETGQPLERIQRDMHRDHWMTAEESVEYGLFDKVVTDFEEVYGK
jgi:ATP-dependent Clp protease protease subunit